MRKVDVFVKGPGSGRETAIRSLQRRPASRSASIQDVTPTPHNGVPPAQAPPRLTARARPGDLNHMARYTGPDCKRCRREKTKLFLKGAKCEPRSARSRSVPTRPASTAAPDQGERVPAAAAREAEGRAHLRRPREAVPRLLRGGATAAPARPVRTCCASSSRAWTTSSTGPASPSPATRPASSSGTATSWSTASRSTSRQLPGERERHRRGAARVARAHARSCWPGPTAGERPVPAWLEVDPQPDAHPRARAARAAGHRHPGAGAADRRALLEVAAHPRGRPTGGPGAPSAATPSRADRCPGQGSSAGVI